MNIWHEDKALKEGKERHPGPWESLLEGSQNAANKIVAQVLVLPSSSYIQKKQMVVKSLHDAEGKEPLYSAGNTSNRW